MLGLARGIGLPRVEITTARDNIACRKVIAGQGGRLLKTREKGSARGSGSVLLYVVDLDHSG